MSGPEAANEQQYIPFRAETRQLLNILIHSLYSDRDVFLRELISNASDALTRMSFIQLTERELLDPDAELAIRIETNPEEGTITIRDSGVGMTSEEMVENLGTIAHSGARAFMEAAKEGNANLHEIIGQFGVGFYSAFMVAEWIRVTSRSYRPDAQAASWYSTGADTFTVTPAEKPERGTEVVIKLKEDAKEFAQEHRLQSIVRTHSDYIPFPIYLNKGEEPVNRRTALWRQSPQGIKPEEYDEFYKHYTLDPEPPLTHLHLSIDAPVQLYALLFVPSSPEHSIFSPRSKDGLKLYARKVLIQEYTTGLLPQALRFVQGVVDSEDIPLNVSREMVQSSRVMSQLKKVLTNKVIDTLKTLGKNNPEKYDQFWKQFNRYIKEGIATEADFVEALTPLLRFHSLQHPDKWISFEQYLQNRKEGQEKIYYILGEDERSIVQSPHLEVFRRKGYDVLLMASDIDPFVLLRMHEFQGSPLANVTGEDISLESEEQPTAETETLDENEKTSLVERFKQVLGEQVADVRTTDRLLEAPARLVEAEGGLPQEVQRVYRMLNREFEAPKRVLEINPRSPIVQRIATLPEQHALIQPIVEQIYEDALLIEGLHPNPAAMINRIQKLMEAALGNSQEKATGSTDPEQTSD